MIVTAARHTRIVRNWGGDPDRYDRARGDRIDVVHDPAADDSTFLGADVGRRTSHVGDLENLLGGSAGDDGFPIVELRDAPARAA